MIPGGWEIVLIIFAILLLFGGKKIPELMKGIGKGIREFNAAKDVVKSQIEDGIKGEDKIEEKKKELPKENREKKEDKPDTKP